MIADNPLVTIITPVYKGAAYLDELIRSVQSQNYSKIEHIIIDDGPTDNGQTIAVLEKYSHLHWWTRENRGQYATMNEGLAAAQGDVVCFVSADDLLAPDVVGDVVGHLREHSDWDGVYGRYFWVDENGAPYRAQNVIHHAPLKFFRYYHFISHSSLFMSRKYLLEHDLWFDDSLHYVGDFDWIVRIIQSGAKLGFLDKNLSLVRVHSGQTSNRFVGAMAEERKRVLRQHKINQPLFYTVLSAVYWYSLGIRLIDVLRQGGVRGALASTGDWLRRKIFASSSVDS